MRRTFRAGRSEAGRRVVLYVSAAERGGSVTFVAGRRIGGAVARNRARRILREAWRVLVPEGPEGLHAVLVARPGIEGAKTQDLAAEMGDLLDRVGVTRK